MWLFILGMLLLSAQYVNAASNYDINAIVQHAWPGTKPTAEGKLLTQYNQIIDTTGDSPQSVIYRAWPVHPGLTLTTIPLMARQYSNYGRIGDLKLLVLDSTNLDVKQRLCLPERVSDDAIQITGLALDTARWKVIPDQTIFGLRVARTGSSCVNPSNEDMLLLLVIESDQLWAVLNGIVLENSTGGWSGNYVGIFHDIKRTLVLAPDSHNGYSYTRVNEKSTESTAYTDASEQCTSKDKPGKASRILCYDDKQYAIPKKLSSLF